MRARTPRMGILRGGPPSASGLGHRPFTAATRVRIPLGVLRFGRAAATVRRDGAVVRRRCRDESAGITHNAWVNASCQRDDRQPPIPDAVRHRIARRTGVAVVACTLALTMLGCGGGDNEATPRSPTASTAAATSAAATAATAAVPDLRGVAVDVRRDPG